MAGDLDNRPQLFGGGVEWVGWGLKRNARRKIMKIEDLCQVLTIIFFPFSLGFFFFHSFFSFFLLVFFFQRLECVCGHEVESWGVG